MIEKLEVDDKYNNGKLKDKINEIIDHINNLHTASSIGKKGGDRNKKRGREYFVNIGKKGAASRWNKRRIAVEKMAKDIK